MSNSASRRDFLITAALVMSMLGLANVAAVRRTCQSKAASEVRSQNHPYELMIWDYVQFKLARVDTREKVIWEHWPEGKVWDFVLTRASVFDVRLAQGLTRTG